MPRFTPIRRRRRGSVLVEYALLLAGIGLASIVGVAVLGHKTADLLGTVAATIPGAHAEDNRPLASADIIPLNRNGKAITLDSSLLVSSTGEDRLQSLLGPDGGAELIVEH